MFGFVAYQLWGTGLEYAQAQDRLEDDFAELLAGTPAPAPSSPVIAGTSTPAPSSPVIAGTSTAAPSSPVIGTPAPAPSSPVTTTPAETPRTSDGAPAISAA